MQLLRHVRERWDRTGPRRWGALAIGMAVVVSGGLPGSAQASTAPPAPTTVSFTFDDTFSDQASALDVLDRYDMNATLYVNSPRVDASSFFLNRELLKRYEARGFEVGGHTLDHVNLATASRDEVRRQVCNDRARLIRMGFRVTSFAYPFGAVRGHAAAAARACGYNSARSLPGLRSPGYGCSRCATAESLPPLDRWRIRTPATARPSTSLRQLKSYVTQAESNGGGWVPLVFHHICSVTCTGNAISIETFSAFVDWLDNRPVSTVVKTVDQVIGGPFKPAPRTTGGGRQRDRSWVVIGSRSFPITGRNIHRAVGHLVLYNRRKGRPITTGTNEFGTEVSVVKGRVDKVAHKVGDMTIPRVGYVLSGNGEAALWLRANAPVGAPVRVTSQPPSAAVSPQAPRPSSRLWDVSSTSAMGLAALALAAVWVGVALMRRRRRSRLPEADTRTKV